MYVFIFREGVFPIICIILAGVQLGGEKVCLRPILFAVPILFTVLRWSGGRRVFLQTISYLSCVYPRRDGQGPETHFTPAASIFRAHRAACSPQLPKATVFIYFQRKTTTFLLIFSFQIVSISLQEHTPIDFTLLTA